MTRGNDLIANVTHEVNAAPKLKAALRKGATRTVGALAKLLGKLVKSFAPQECANYFRHAGYLP